MQTSRIFAEHGLSPTDAEEVILGDRLRLASIRAFSARTGGLTLVRPRRAGCFKWLSLFEAREFEWLRRLNRRSKTDSPISNLGRNSNERTWNPLPGGEAHAHRHPP